MLEPGRFLIACDAPLDGPGRFLIACDAPLDGPGRFLIACDAPLDVHIHLREYLRAG